MNLRKMSLVPKEKRHIETFYVEAYQYSLDPITEFVQQKKICRLKFTNFSFIRAYCGDWKGYADIDWTKYDSMRGCDLSMVQFSCALTGYGVDIPQMDIIYLKERVSLTVRSTK